MVHIIIDAPPHSRRQGSVCDLVNCGRDPKWIEKRRLSSAIDTDQQYLQLSRILTFPQRQQARLERIRCFAATALCFCKNRVCVSGAAKLGLSAALRCRHAKLQNKLKNFLPSVIVFSCFPFFARVYVLQQKAIFRAFDFVLAIFMAALNMLRVRWLLPHRSSTKSEARLDLINDHRGAANAYFNQLRSSWN